MLLKKPLQRSYGDNYFPNNRVQNLSNMLIRGGSDVQYLSNPIDSVYSQRLPCYSYHPYLQSQRPVRQDFSGAYLRFFYLR